MNRVPLCRHCSRCRAVRPRGLCCACYRQIEIREMYPTNNKYGRRPQADFYGVRPMPIPTDALPGTLERVIVLEERARNGQELFHPDDATWE